MIRPIVTLVTELRKPCEEVTKEDNIKSIIQDLKDTLSAHKNGIGLSANQIGIQKRISFIRVPKKFNEKTKETEYGEIVIINPKITEKIGNKYTVKEGCLSFPGLWVMTDRYPSVIVEFLNENLETRTGMFDGLDGLAVQHEIDHLLGLTIFNRKHKAR